MRLAHAFGERYSLPVPLALFLLGGALVVVVSFLLVFRRAVPAPSAQESPDEVPPSPLRPVSAVLSVLGLAVLVLVGLFGKQELSENLDPTVFWIVVWIVVPLSCGVLGDWTRPWNPFRTLAALADRPGLRRTLLGRTSALPWSLAWWPPVLLFTLLVFGELVFPLTATRPVVIGTALLVYAVISALAGLLFGPAWAARGEVWGVLWDVWGRLGFWRHGAPGRRGFGGGLAVGFSSHLSRLVFVLLMLVNVNFDGLSSTARWDGFTRSLGVHAAALQGLKVVAFVLLVVLAFVVFASFALLAERRGGQTTSLSHSLVGLLPSLVPIAFAYLLAHYASYVLTNLQLLFPLVGNPGFASWPLHLPYPFSDAFEVNLHLFPPAFYWYLAIIAIVLAHVAAVLLAHAHLGRNADARAGRASEYPWLVAMVLYTVFSLALVASTETASAPATTATSAAATPAANLLPP